MLSITTTHRPRAVYPGEKEDDMIETFGNGYTVFFEGDEIYFDTYEEAEQFIEEMEGQE